MKYASLGSISSGTLRTEDLLPAFADALEDLVNANGGFWANRNLLIAEARAVDPQSDDADELVQELQDALQEFAPPYCYFGAHEGDGADFGFWVVSDLFENTRQYELERGGELPCACCFDGSEFLVVNDHGNATLYAKQAIRGRFIPEGEERTMGDIIVRQEWVAVWSIV
jgi:hypothetical protein